MGRLTAKVRSLPGVTSHHVAKEGGVVPCEEPATLEVVEQDGAFFLFRKDEDGNCLSDTWHLTLEEAQEQAEFEFGVAKDEWTAVTDEPGQ